MNRIFVEKKAPHAAAAHHLLADLHESLGLPGLSGLRIAQRYEVVDLSEEEFSTAARLILSEPQVDDVSPVLLLAENETAFAVEFLPGQFDQRADSAAQCCQILSGKERPEVFSAKVIILAGNLTEEDIGKIKSYVINAVDSHEVPVAETSSRQAPAIPADVAILTDFLDQDAAAIRTSLGLAMTTADVSFCQAYFRDEEKRAPSLTEIKLLDTYWSDHCRHTTFLTALETPTFAPGAEVIERAWHTYLATREKLGRSEKPITLMDIALIGMRELRASGELDNLEISEEVNAASIVVPVEIDGQPAEEWLVMFKNETHNHPTEIEPFGGAATCLGGCIRDPLSGRSYVYQAMRVTGAGDPLTPFSETLPGKLPQKKICQVAAKGYSSYGNQIGLATGQVAEIYHPGYVAKRLEIGAVVSAVPRSHVFRGTPAAGDVILLIGGRTGRDGVGGATGSSKEHTETALQNSAEVQKGDAPTERKIQRLFRNPELTRKIKICNDFGAGGVSVAIGEIAPSLVIILDEISKKYDGLDGTELAISESQERMAVCVAPEEIAYFIAEADKENLECRHVADVTDSGRLIMTWRGKTIVDLSRAFLDTNGVQQTAHVHIAAPLTATLHSQHERKTNLLERSSPESLREGPITASERTADVLRRVHRANQKSGIAVPETAGERQQLHRAIRAVEEQQIRSCLSDLFLDPLSFDRDWQAAGSLGGAEQKVIPEPSGSHFIKANAGIYHGHWMQYFDRLHYHRIIFPDTAYTFMGFIEDGDCLAAMVMQVTVPAFRSADGMPMGATRAQVETYMMRLGAFRVRNDDYYLPAENLFIEDLHDENVLLDEDGETLRFIDPVFYQRPLDLPIPKRLTTHLASLNICSQKGLGEIFDGSVGAGTVLWPFGGKNQLTPPDAMVAKLPLLAGESDTATFMAWGFDPFLSEKSPFHGAVYAVTESVCKAVAAGADLAEIRLTLQEYFPRLGNDPQRWGLPFAALLGAFHAQHSLRLAAIGGKDSMSGTFNELDVPPTLVSFALAPGKASLALSPEFKKSGSQISLLEIPRDGDELPDFEKLKQAAANLHALNVDGKIASLHHIGKAGLAAGLAKMAFGNGIGAECGQALDFYSERYFSFLIEHTADLPASLGAKMMGRTTTARNLVFNGETHSLAELQQAWCGTLEPIYPTQVKTSGTALLLENTTASPRSRSFFQTVKPKVIIPSFPGTNSEYDSAKAFRQAGGEAEILVFRNLTSAHIEESLKALATHISQSQILMFPGGFSAGDEPDGSAKFIATIIRSPRVADAIMDLLKNRDGLILGICNGFQALIKTGLVPYGEIREPQADAPTLVHNGIGRHISRYAQTRIVSKLSPWLAPCPLGAIHQVPVSHGEGKFYASSELIATLAANGQVATQYVDDTGEPSLKIAFNPNSSLAAIEGITSPCGRVFGKMAHTERTGICVAKNIPGDKYQPLFKAGISYYFEQ